MDWQQSNIGKMIRLIIIHRMIYKVSIHPGIYNGNDVIYWFVYWYCVFMHWNWIIDKFLMSANWLIGFIGILLSEWNDTVGKSFLLMLSLIELNIQPERNMNRCYYCHAEVLWIAFVSVKLKGVGGIDCWVWSTKFTGTYRAVNSWT